MKGTRKLEPYEEEALKLFTKGFRLLIERREQEIKDEMAEQAKSVTKEIVPKPIETELQIIEGEILPPVCTITDIMSYFQVSRSTISRLIKDGKIRSYKVGQQIRFKREWIFEYEESLIAASFKDT